MRTGAEAAAIAESLIGIPYKHLPGNPAQHKVMGRCSDGSPITVSDLEMTMNDAWSIDSCHGIGTYAAITQENDHFNHEALPVAIKLYGCQPIDLHKAEEN